jgi:hypothetical protein
MRSLGLDPETDMMPEWEAQLQDIMLSELDYVGPLAQDILAAMHAGDPVEPFHSRVELWTSRYNEVVNTAIQVCSGVGQKLQWHLGATEQHCDICARLDGIVAFASEWDELGVYPQRPPNPALSKVNGGCEGWRCDCSCTPTDQRRSPNAYNTIMDAVSG